MINFNNLFNSGSYDIPKDEQKKLITKFKPIFQDNRSPKATAEKVIDGKKWSFTNITDQQTSKYGIQVDEAIVKIDSYSQELLFQNISGEGWNVKILKPETNSTQPIS